MLHIYTGDGKGKTTAVIGLSIRSAGASKKVLFTQFLKDGSSSEIKILENIKNIEVFSAKKHFGFIKNLNDVQIDEMKVYYTKYFNDIQNKCMNNKYDLIVLDEFIAAYNNNIIDNISAIKFIIDMKDITEVAITGRNVDDKLKDIAAYVSEVKKIKHPYDKGIIARLGIEF